MPSRNILVTGATGFVGRHMVSRLIEEGWTVHPFSRATGHDLQDASSFEPFLGKNIKCVIHLAAKTFIPDSWPAPGIFYEINTLGTQRALDFCRTASARLIYVSTYVYGTPLYLPIDEKHRTNPNNPYSHSKWLAEELCRFYAAELGVQVTILRPFNLFGPGQNDLFLLPAILKQARAGGGIHVTDLSPRRDYLYVEDFVDACICSLSLETSMSIFNVGSGRSLSVLQILEQMQTYAPHDLAWESSDIRRPDEIPETLADISSIRHALGWSPRTSLEDFLKKELS